MPKPVGSRKAPTAERTVTSREARRLFGDLLNRAEYAGERIVVTRRGRVVAAIIGPDELRELPQHAA